jgi:hypothetical protein
MSIEAIDFQNRLSGGSSNASGDASLGGVKSSELASENLNSLFDAVSAAEALAGLTEYRCLYLHNANATDTMVNAVLFISSNTAAPDTQIAIGVGTSSKNGTEQTVANEATAPSGVSFTEPSTADGGLSLGDLDPGEHRAYWIRRTINANAVSNPNDSATLGFRCETV